MSHLLIYLFFVKEFKMTSINNQVFEIDVLTKCETISPADLTPAQYALYVEAIENGYMDQHDNQHKSISMIGLLTVNGNTHVVAANKYGFGKLELLNGKAVQTTGSIGGKFDTTNGFQGTSEQDSLKVIMPTKTYAF